MTSSLQEAQEMREDDDLKRATELSLQGKKYNLLPGIVNTRFFDQLCSADFCIVMVAVDPAQLAAVWRCK